MRLIRNALLVLGFASFVTGMLSLVLVLIGANLSFLAWIDRPGTPQGVIIRILLIGGGLMLAYLALNPPGDDPDEPVRDL